MSYRNFPGLCLLVYLFLWPLNGYAQRYYEVVCNADKGEILILPQQEESSSDRLVLRGDFVSYAEAEKWINDYHPSWRCATSSAKEEEMKSPPVSDDPVIPSGMKPFPGPPLQEQQTPSPPPFQAEPTASSSGAAEAPPPLAYHRNLFKAGVVISNLSQVLDIVSPENLGWSLGLDRFWGKEYFVGSGVGFQYLAGAFAKIPNFDVGGGLREDPFGILGFNLSVYAGRRSDPDKPLTIRGDVGFQMNRFLLTESPAQGWYTEPYNFAICYHVAFGFRRFFLELQGQNGINDFFENKGDYRLLAMTISLGLYF